MKSFSRSPLTLYRIQQSLTVRLRSSQDQMAKGRSSFDLKLGDKDGLVHPISPSTHFHTPNGMSLRPAGDTMIDILRRFRGDPKVYTIWCGLELPSHFVLYHEHSDHYSLQTTESVPLEELNRRMTEFLKSLPCQNRDQFLESLEDVDDQDN